MAHRIGWLATRASVVCATLVLALGSTTLRADEPAKPAGTPAQPPAAAPAQPPAAAQPATPATAQPVAPGGAAPVVPAKPVTPVMPGQPAAPAQTFKPGEEPQIVFDAPVFDFGKIMAGEPVRHDFFFTNRGKSTLEILAVRPSCGCTTAGEWDKKVEPGKSGKIPLQLNTASVNGVVSKVVTVTTNVPGKPDVQLTLKGEIWQPIELKPPYLNLGSITDGKEHSMTTQVINHFDQPIELKNVQSSNPAFRVEVKPTVPGREFEIKVTAIPPFKQNANNSTITIDTGHPKKPQVSLTAYCYVPQPVEVSPIRLNIPSPITQEGTTRAVYVKNNTQSPLKVSDLAVSDPKVKAELKEDLPGMSFRVVIAFPKGYAIPAGDALKVTFKTSDPAYTNVIVPVSPINMQAPTAAMPYRQPIKAAGGGSANIPTASDVTKSQTSGGNVSATPIPKEPASAREERKK